jgi:hypothetical protein
LVVVEVVAIDGRPTEGCLNKDAAVRSRVRQESGTETFTCPVMESLRDDGPASIRADPVAAAAAHE